mmetsp:Transcript_4885/g.11368  ORF Transcript_4885/g.11368 Transcript_4885/m.11368 type:complete len:250 (+) Transcript_4885:753-1502(+)
MRCCFIGDISVHLLSLGSYFSTRVHAGRPPRAKSAFPTRWGRCLMARDDGSWRRGAASGWWGCASAAGSTSRLAGAGAADDPAAASCVPAPSAFETATASASRAALRMSSCIFLWYCLASSSRARLVALVRKTSATSGFRSTPSRTGGGSMGRRTWASSRGRSLVRGSSCMTHFRRAQYTSSSESTASLSLSRTSDSWSAERDKKSLPAATTCENCPHTTSDAASSSSTHPTFWAKIRIWIAFGRSRRC